MIVAKKETYELLQELGYDVYHIRPDVIESVPCLIYHMALNESEVDIKNEIGRQEQTYEIDVWALNSSQATEILIELDALLRQNGYIPVNQLDVPDEKYSHVNCRYKLII